MGGWGPLVMLALAIAPAVGAKTLYRCPGQGPNGATLIQDSPCPGGQPAATTLDANEVRVSAQRQRQLAAERARIERQQPGGRPARRQAAHRGPGPTEAQRRRQACEDARAWRDAQRRKLSLNRTYEQLSAIDRQVRERCRGVP